MAKKVVKKKAPTTAQLIQKFTQTLVDIINHKKAGLVIVVEKEKGGISFSSASNDFTHRDTHAVINQLIEIVHPEIAELGKLFGQLEGALSNKKKSVKKGKK